MAVAKSFADAKAKVVVNGRSKGAVDQAVQEIRKAGGTATGICADISEDAGAQQLVDTAIREFDRIDILINNAALLGPCKSHVWEITPKEWREVMAVNITGAFLCSRLVATWMMNNGVSGRIINVSTGATHTQMPKMSPYIVSKCGLESLTSTTALDAGWNNITVAGIELGSLQTEMSKSFFSLDYFLTLSPPETVVPLFLYMASVPGIQIHGRILSAWGLEKDREIETILTSPLTMLDRMVFPPLKKDDKVINRLDPDIVCFDRAENCYGMPESVRGLLTRMANDANFARYPDERYPSLRKKLSEHLEISEDCFTFGNGSSELVERAVRTFVPPGKEALTTAPGWFMFDRYCAALGVVNRSVPFKKTNGRFHFDLDTMAGEITVNTRLIYLINPSNPLGVGIDRDEFMHFLQRIPAHIPVVVDEAYIEFSTNPQTLRTNEIIGETDRLVIGLRTFSKFYGLAALRIGYAFASPKALQLFNRLEPLFALSPIAESAAILALEDKEYATRILENTNRERVRIQKRLASAGLDYLPSEIHFMLVETPIPPEKVYSAFEEEGIFLSRGVLKDRYIIFPIARPEQNDRNLEILCSL
ncbi:MAG: SDR family NAD(P)-dependent oxidoreductase [Proteobacteria bacterium]|nr:SDR family NAD(P)-dependent oxidoreductase [Pseudomonadota bacterium]